MLVVIFRHRPLIIQIAGLLCCLLLPRAALAMDDVEQARNLMKKMSTANRELDYQGIFTYEHAGILKSIRITHVVHDDLEYENLLYLNGPKREIVRSGVSTRCRSFGDEFLKGVPMPSEFSSHLETHYELLLKGEDRVADREVRVIHVVPKDSMRYGFILSLDRETGLLLQSLLIGSNRRVMERFQYVDISYQPSESDIAALVMNAGPSTEESAADDNCEQQIDEGVLWQAKWLPGGFQLVSASVKEAGDTSLVYSDGLSFVSIFINSASDQAFPPIQAQKGATIAQMERLNHNGEDYLVCVVGEVPPATAERIAKFVAPR